MARNEDIRFLSEQLSCLESDMNSLKVEMAQVRAQSARVSCAAASLRADTARLETKLDEFRDSFEAHFDGLEKVIGASVPSDAHLPIFETQTKRT
jgi:septal ring factor EnvC (AmiA/AmiB activator)